VRKKNGSWKRTARLLAICLGMALIITALPCEAWQVLAENAVSGEAPEAKPVKTQQTANYYKKEGETFTHPGLLHTQESIDAMKKNIADGVQPSLTAYHQLLADSFSWDGWRGRPLEHVVRGGSGDNRAQMYIDIERAYHLALLWNLTGEERFGYAAVYILNVWADNMKSLTGNADRFLAAGIYGYEFANVAELVRDREDFHKEAFDNLMLNVFYPMNHDFLTNHNGTNRGVRIQNYWANWDLCNIASMLAIGIYTDRADIYNEAVSYYMNGEGNGSLLNAMPYVYENGLAQWQEAGRDQGHTTLGISLCGSINEMAWSQGMDFYGLADNRLLKAAEYIAKYNNWDDNVPFSTYTHFNSATGHPETNTGVSGASRGHRRPCYTVIYNHYVNRRGMEAPELKKVLHPEGADPVIEGGTRQGDEFGWQSLTFHNVSTRVGDGDAAKVDGALSDGVYRFINRKSGKCLVDRDGILQSAAKGTMETEWWKVKCCGDGTCTISNVKTGKVITLNGTEYTSNSPIYQLTTQFILADSETGEMNQQLYFMKRSDDFCYRIASVPSSYVMALDGGRTEDDVKVIQYQYSQDWDQDWMAEQKESEHEIAYFNFDDKTEGLKGAGAIAAAEGECSIVPDKERGNVLSLNGDAFLTVTKEDQGSVLGENQAVTISYYSKLDGKSGGSVVCAVSESGASYLEIKESGGKVTVSESLGDETHTAEGTAGSGWNHIVVVLENGEIQLYINGSLASVQKDTGTLSDILGSKSSLKIGSSKDGAKFSGLLDHFTIYNYAMDASKIAAVEERKMLADFTFDDEVDGFISDHAKAINAGTMVLSDEVKEGQSGKSLQLDGTGSNYIKVVNKDNKSLVSRLSELTISYWSKVTQDGACWASYLSPDDNIQAYENERLIGIMENSGTLAAERYKNSGKRLLSITAPVQRNEWKHVAVTYTEELTVLYVNGRRVGSLKSKNTLEDILGDNGIFYIGKANWSKESEFFNGLLDNFHIYNFALSDAQIEKDYQGYHVQNIPEDEEDHSADKDKAKEVIQKIENIGTVAYTDACRQKIEEARSAYEALTEAQKVWVSNIDALLRAERQYRELTPIDPKMLAYFTFDDETSGFASGNAVAQKKGEVLLSEKSVHGKALRLGKDNSQSYLKLLDKNGDSLLKYCKELTVSYWGKVYNKSSNWGFYTAKDDAPQNFKYDRYLAVNDTGGTITAERYYNINERPDQLSGDSSWSEWRYITAVYSKEKTILYMDGVKIGEQASSDTVSAILGEDPVAYVGKANWGSGEYYSGLIDEMKIYNHARTAEQVKADYEEYTKPEAEKTCIASFSFDNETDGFSSQGTAQAVSKGKNQLAEGISGKALSLDGTGSNYLTLKNAQGECLLNEEEEITVSYWSQTKNEGTNWAFYASGDKEAQTLNYEKFVAVNDGGFELTAERHHNTGRRPEHMAQAAVQKNDWKHIAVVYGKHATTVYVNGTESGSAEADFALPEILGKNGAVYLGKANWGSGEFYNGIIDEVSIYNYALTPDEIGELSQKYQIPYSEKKKLAAFTFNDTATGFSSEGAKAASAQNPSLSQDSVSGKALELKDNTYLAVTDPSEKSLLTGCKELTISYWGKAADFDNSNWLLYAAADDNAQPFNYEKYIGISDQWSSVIAERFQNSGSRPEPQAAEASANEWRHVTVVYGRRTTTIYINGKNVSQTDTKVLLEDILGENSVLYIGKANWGAGEYGSLLLDEMSIYNYALSSEEVENEYKSVPKVPDDQHTHEFGTKWKTDETKHWKECACGEHQDEAVHTEDKGTVTKAPTETVAGEKTYQCSVCGYLMRTEEIPALSETHVHEFGTEWKIGETKHWKECICGEHQDEAEHIEGKGTVTLKPTETTPGEKTYLCSVCGYTMKTEEIPALGENHVHEFDKEWNHDETKHWKECICGERQDEAEHTEGKGTVTKAPTETAAGEKTYLCSICGYTMRTEEIPALGGNHNHEFGTEWEMDENNHWKECPCGERREKAAHTEGKGTVTVKPTETTAGEKIYSCRVCGYLMRREEIPALGENHVHEFDKEWETDETKHWKECICGERQDETVHEKNQGVVTKEPTTTEQGEITYSCTICGYLMEVKKTDALGGGSQEPSITEEQKNKEAADAVSKLIEQIGTVTVSDSCRDKIMAARNAYNTLTDAQKKLVKNLNVLSQAEDSYRRQKNEFDKEMEGTQSEQEAEKSILSADTDKGDVKGSSFMKMRLKGTGGKKSVKLSWRKPKGTKGYLLYGAACGKKLKLIKKLPASRKSYTVKRLAKGKYYRYVLAAYKIVNGKKRVIGKSTTVHVCTNGGKYGNPSSVVYKKKKITLKKGKTFTLKPSYKNKKKVKIHSLKFRFESSNTKIASVTKKGKIKAKKKGKCSVCMYAQNGLYKTVKVTVK